LHRGKQEADERADDGDHHQQFNKREGISIGWHGPLARASTDSHDETLSLSAREAEAPRKEKAVVSADGSLSASAHHATLERNTTQARS
jgi:hypothetical protein